MIRFAEIGQVDPRAPAHADFDLAFASAPIDERGQHSQAVAQQSAATLVRVAYDPEAFTLTIDGTAYRVSEQERIRRAFTGQRLLLDATSLDPVEMLLLCRIFLGTPEDHRRIGFVYVEPDRYLPASNAAGMEYAFTFSDGFKGFHPVPGFAGELREDEEGRLVACLGFEADRLERILQNDDSNFIRHLTLICGVPPYRTSWEVHALLAHHRVISQHQSWNLTYAGANNPKATYERLEDASRAVGTGERLIIAPLGSKPSAIGMALFACCRDNVRLKYDFPIRTAGRSEGVGAVHRYVAARR